MKYLSLFYIFIFIVSCTNVEFADPQPKNLKEIKAIPDKFQGVFMMIDSPDTFLYTVNAKSITALDNAPLPGSKEGGDLIIDSTMVVKFQGNTLYINHFNNKGYECFRIQLSNSYQNENILLSSIYVLKDDDALKNIEYERFDDKNGKHTEKKYFITKINYNQLQQLFKGDPDKLTRLK